MRPKPPLTLERLNEIHREWMELDMDAPQQEKNRVFALMNERPRAYISISADGSKGVAMIDGTPMCVPLPLAECQALYGNRVHKQFAWQYNKWVDYQAKTSNINNETKGN